MTWVLPLNNHRQTFVCHAFFSFFLFSSFLHDLSWPNPRPWSWCHSDMHLWKCYICALTFETLGFWIVLYWFYTFSFFQHGGILGRKLSNATINLYLLWQCTLRVNMVFYINTLKASIAIDLKDTHKLITLLISMAWQLKDVSRYPVNMHAAICWIWQQGICSTLSERKTVLLPKKYVIKLLIPKSNKHCSCSEKELVVSHGLFHPWV